MTEVQAILIELLSEIDELCKKNDLKYFLAQEAAVSAYRSNEFESRAPYIGIFMTLPDIFKFYEIVKKQNREDRCVDSILDNDSYPDFVFKYCNNNTLFINLYNNSGIKSFGIFVNILILRRPYKGIRGFLIRFLESGWIYNYEDYYSESLSRKRKIIKKIASILRLIPRKAYQKMMIKLWKSTQKDLSYDEELMFKTSRGVEYNFPKGMFSNTKDVNFEGNKYPIPVDHETFFTVMYKHRWQEIEFKKVDVKEGAIIDPRLPYEYYFKYLKDNNISIDFQEEKMCEKSAKTKATRTNKKVNRAWKYVLRTGARFQMWEKYMPQKDYIQKLYDKKDWEVLKEVLNEYDQVVTDFYYNKGLTVCFDKEICNIYLEMLSYFGQKELAEKLRNKIPEIHWEPIVIDK